MARESDQYGPAETKKRMENALRRALETPHKPNEKFVGKSAVTGKRIPKQKHHGRRAKR